MTAACPWRGAGYFVEAPLYVIIFLSARRFLMCPLPPLFPPTQPTPLRADGKLKQKAPTEQHTAENHSFWGAHIMWFQSKHRAGNYLLTLPLKTEKWAQLRVTKKQTPPSQTESQQENDAVMKSQK